MISDHATKTGETPLKMTL